MLLEGIVFCLVMMFSVMLFGLLKFLMEVRMDWMVLVLLSENERVMFWWFGLVW